MVGVVVLSVLYRSTTIRSFLPTRRRHVGICPKRHDIDTASEEPKRPYVADMVCVVSATCRRHVVVSVVLKEKNPRHDADITSQDHQRRRAPPMSKVEP
jgi:hypothetical protein